VAEAQGVDVRGTAFVVEQRSTGVHDGMASTALACRNRRRSSGAAAAAAEVAEAGAGGAAGGGGGGDGGDLPAGPLLVRLFSTDHHLQRLHDVESLMPRLSALQPLRGMRARVEYTHVPYPYGFAPSRRTTRRATRARLASELQVLLLRPNPTSNPNPNPNPNPNHNRSPSQVLLLNLRGMQDARPFATAEFLHADNWRRLLDVRDRLSQDRLDRDMQQSGVGGDGDFAPTARSGAAGARARSPEAVQAAAAMQHGAAGVAPRPAVASDARCDLATDEAMGLLAGVQAAVHLELETNPNPNLNPNSPTYPNPNPGPSPSPSPNLTLT